MKKFSLFLLVIIGMIGHNFPIYAKSFSGESDLYVTDEKEENEDFQNKIMWTNAVDDPLVYDSAEEMMMKTMGDTQHVDTSDKGTLKVYNGKEGEKTIGSHIVETGIMGKKTQGRHTTFTGNEPDDMSEPSHITLMSKEQADRQRQADFEQRVKDGKYDDLPELKTGGDDIPSIPSSVV